MDKKRKPFNDRVTPQRILADIPISRVKEDLERYREMMIEIGAFDAAIVSSDDIIIDERVRAKCIYPKCGLYGMSINCPPHAPDLDFIRKVIKNYRYAILFCVEDKTGVLIGRGFRNHIGKENPAIVLLNTICSEIESRCFYEGYHLSLAFGQGSCKSYWCPDQPCAALQSGGRCRFPLKARSSMEAVGIDAFTMAARCGWEIYPCGERAEREDLPHVLLVGLVLVW
jgi:predicted metal-binding protein